jgi:hypothetical protein
MMKKTTTMELCDVCGKKPMMALVPVRVLDDGVTKGYKDKVLKNGAVEYVCFACLTDMTSLQSIQLAPQ